MKRIFSGFIALFLLGAPALAAAQVPEGYPERPVEIPMNISLCKSYVYGSH